MPAAILRVNGQPNAISWLCNWSRDSWGHTVQLTAIGHQPYSVQQEVEANIGTWPEYFVPCMLMANQPRELLHLFSRVTHHLFLTACPHASHTSYTLHTLSWLWLVCCGLSAFSGPWHPHRLVSILAQVPGSPSPCSSMPGDEPVSTTVQYPLQIQHSRSATATVLCCTTVHASFLQGLQSSNFICLSGIVLRQARALSFLGAQSFHSLHIVIPTPQPTPTPTSATASALR